jgi:GNAT superfamily N-acetyltransferase
VHASFYTWGGKVKTLRIRAAKERDIGLFIKLWKSYIVNEYAQGSGVPASEENMEVYRDIFNLYVSGEEKGVVLFVGECAVFMFGTAGTSRIQSERDPIANGWGVYVEPDHQGQGIAEALYKAAHKELKEMGFKTVGGHCYLENEAAWAVLDKMGYKKIQYVVVKDL